MKAKRIPPDIKTFVQTAQKIKDELGRISIILIMRKFKLNFQKAEEIIKFIN